MARWWVQDIVEIKLISSITNIRVIAIGRRIFELERLQKVYGPARWRKLKGVARVMLPNGSVITGEVHWYEAHGVGRRELKLKRVMQP